MELDLEAKGGNENEMVMNGHLMTAQKIGTFLLVSPLFQHPSFVPGVLARQLNSVLEVVPQAT